MKIKMTEEQLKKIIVEEIQKNLTGDIDEGFFGDLKDKVGSFGQNRKLDKLTKKMNKNDDKEADVVSTKTINEPGSMNVRGGKIMSKVRGAGKRISKALGGGKPSAPDAPDAPTQGDDAPSDATGETAPEETAPEGDGLSDEVKSSTAQISLPHAIVLQGLMKNIAGTLQKELGFMSREERQDVFPKVMNYIKNLDKLANPVIAEQEGQSDLKARLMAKHGKKLQSKNLPKVLPGKIFQAIQNAIGSEEDFVYALLDVLTDPTGGITDVDADKFAKSLEKPKMAKAQHRAALENAQIIANNIASIVSSNMKKDAGPAPKPLPEDVDNLTESLDRMSILAGIKK